MFGVEEGKTEPTGIACDISQDFVGRPIKAKPRDCEYDWGHRFALGNQTDADLECASDWVGSKDSPIIEYGKSISRGNIVCSSETNGLTCKNEKQHGFFLSRSAQKLF
jgi:hypothetical protein